MRISGIKHTIKKEAPYFITMTVVNWVDVFTRPVYKDAIIDSLNYCIKNKGLNVFAYVLMTNHLHLIVSAEDQFRLSDIVRDFKTHTSKKIIALIESESESRREWLLNIFALSAAESNKHQKYKFWQSGNHAIELYSEQFVWKKIQYIHDNPVRAKIVSRQEDYIYSSARNYFGMESVLTVFTLHPRLQTVR
ncbi:MAG: transposase [Bacteroidetes bacterium]|nr:transposase [Bacteroidota bacterium]